MTPDGGDPWQPWIKSRALFVKPCRLPLMTRGRKPRHIWNPPSRGLPFGRKFSTQVAAQLVTQSNPTALLSQTQQTQAHMVTLLLALSSIQISGNAVWFCLVIHQSCHVDFWGHVGEHPDVCERTPPSSEKGGGAGRSGTSSDLAESFSYGFKLSVIAGMVLSPTTLL